MFDHFCDKITYVESFYDSTNKISNYKINDKKYVTVTDVDKSVPMKIHKLFNDKITYIDSIFNSTNKILHYKTNNKKDVTETNIIKSKLVKKPKKKYQSFSEKEIGHPGKDEGGKANG